MSALKNDSAIDYNKVKKQNLLKKGSIFIKNKEADCEKILKCLKNILAKNKQITFDNLSVCRLESLIRTIENKKIFLENINTDKEPVSYTENLISKLEKYTDEANKLIETMIENGNITKDCCKSLSKE